MNGKIEEWTTAMKEAGHTPKLDDGKIDIFVFDQGYCNGPGCVVCDWRCCWHCDDIEDIPKCKGR